jgi:hypothetical protein
MVLVYILLEWPGWDRTQIFQSHNAEVTEDNHVGFPSETAHGVLGLVNLNHIASSSRSSILLRTSGTNGASKRSQVVDDQEESTRSPNPLSTKRHRNDWYPFVSRTAFLMEVLFKNGRFEHVRGRPSLWNRFQRGAVETVMPWVSPSRRYVYWFNLSNALPMTRPQNLVIIIGNYYTC